MTKKGTLRPEQISLARKLLNELPVRDNRKTREEAVGILEKDFRKAFKKGYTPKELSMVLKNAGIIIPACLTEKFLIGERTDCRKKERDQGGEYAALTTKKSGLDCGEKT